MFLRAPTGPRRSGSLRPEALDHLLERVDDILLEGLVGSADIAKFEAPLDVLHVVAHLVEDLGEGDRRPFSLQDLDRFRRLLDNRLLLCGLVPS